RMALAETRRRTQRFSLSTQNRRDCRLGKKRRLVLLFACETLLPVRGPLPVTWHTRAMIIPLNEFFNICQISLSPVPPDARWSWWFWVEHLVNHLFYNENAPVINPRGVRARRKATKARRI